MFDDDNEEENELIVESEQGSENGGLDEDGKAM